MPDAVLVSLITVGLPIVSGAIAYLWQERKKFLEDALAQRESAIEEAKRAGREEERAEAYKRASKQALDQKNAEIGELAGELGEAKRWIARLTDMEIPTLQSALSSREDRIRELSESIEILASSYRTIAEALGGEPIQEEVES